MKANVSLLRYWKTENTRDTCEDASAGDAAAGVFAIADGVGSSSFAGTWASALVQASLNHPLNSTDHHEVDWWLSMPRAAYRAAIPSIDLLPAYVRESARLGGFSTFLQAHTVLLDVDTLEVNCIAFGDSCAFVVSGEHGFSTYPMNAESAFDAAPVTLPANPAKFNPLNCRPVSWTTCLRAGDVLVLATDAVARWVISRAHGRMTHIQDALREVMLQTEDTWPAFIDAQRATWSMANDDSTVLIIRLHDDSDNLGGQELCVTDPRLGEIVDARRASLAPSIAANAKLDVARLWGDGEAFVDVPDRDELLPVVLRARAVADAFYAMRQVFSDLLNYRQTKSAAIQAWAQYAGVLSDEPCAAKLINSLRAEGIIT